LKPAVGWDADYISTWHRCPVDSNTPAGSVVLQDVPHKARATCCEWSEFLFSGAHRATSLEEGLRLTGGICAAAPEPGAAPVDRLRISFGRCIIGPAHHRPRPPLQNALSGVGSHAPSPEIFSSWTSAHCSPRSDALPRQQRKMGKPHERSAFYRDRPSAAPGVVQPSTGGSETFLRQQPDRRFAFHRATPASIAAIAGG